jgi:uncharacterized protein YecT (DUF1311 family)
MRLFPENRNVRMLVFAAQLLLACALLPANATAQENGGAQPPEAPPVPATFQNLIPVDQLAFLAGEAGRPSKEMYKDKRFRALLKLAVPHTEYHYGSDMPLDDAIEKVLEEGATLPVDVRDQRYVTVASQGGPYLRGRGLLWFDLQSGIVLGCFFFQPTNGEPSPTLTVFSRQLTQTDLSMGQLPPEFIGDEIQWATRVGIPPVTPRYFIPGNGKKYVLVHDEDYCGHPNGLPAPPENVCQPMNADAADADVNAAYFMKETHNQANATAWMLGPDQVEWIGFRDRSCGGGPAGLPCRIRITRQRTRVLLGPRPRR